MRAVRAAALVLVVVVVVGTVGVWLALDRAAARALEDGGTRALGVATRVDYVRVEPFTGAICLGAVRVANPEGFGEDDFLEVGSGRVDVRMASFVAGDRVEIERVVLRDLVLRLEKARARANYEAPRRTGERETGAEPGRRVVVRELVLRDVVANVDRAVLDTGAGDLVLEIPEIALRDVGSHSDRGVLADELSGVVIAAIVRAMVDKGVELPLGLVRRATRLPLDVGVEVTGRVSQTLGNVAGAGGEAVGRVLEEAVGENVERASDALRSLLGGGRGEKPAPAR